MATSRKRTPKNISEFDILIGSKLKRLREDVRRMSPEDVEARSKGKVSASYLRRIESGESSPTVEKLNDILTALGSNLGLFFEDMIEDSDDVSAQDRRYQRILQRSLERDRSETAMFMHIVGRGLDHRS